ncbi:MAG: porin family protein, partial [Hyphomicrobiales bacterium]|nr:porin family protein [Hyphomicrobiales bacterium]
MSSAVAIGLLIGSPALAADLPSREPAPAPVYAAPVFTWTGFYAGVTAGYAGDKFTYPLTVTGAPIAASASVTSGGLLFGATIGYNYQFANNFVLGLEADWSWANVKGQVGLNAAIGPIGIGATAGSELKSFGTLRARAGYAWNRALFYVTGGFAWGEVDSGLNAALGPIGVALSRSNNLTGWVIGAGVEYALTSNWSFKTEYLYADLGKGSLFAAVVGPATLNLDVDTKVHIVRAGLNYRFGGFLGAPVSPVFSGPTVNWSGFYVGASGGYAGDKFNYPLAVTGLPVAASA